MNQLVIYLSVRLIAHRKIQPCLLIYDAFIMGKGIEAGFPVVCAHAALAESAESHLACGEVNDGVIDTPAPESASGCNTLCRFPVGSKDVKSQRMGQSVDIGDYFI